MYTEFSSLVGSVAQQNNYCNGIHETMSKPKVQSLALFTYTTKSPNCISSSWEQSISIVKNWERFYRGQTPGTWYHKYYSNATSTLV
jgi:hypothetical protein